MRLRNVVNSGFSVLLLLGISNVNAQAIKDLTTSKNANKTAARPTTTSVQTPRITSNLKKHSVGLGLGQTFLMGDFDKHGENEISWDILYNYSASHSFELMAGFHSSKYTFKDSFVRTTGLTTSIKGKLYQFDSFAPFALGGLGFYSPKVRRVVNNQILESESKLVFGVNLGAGVDLRLNENFTVGMLAQYHNPFDVKQELGPEVEGSYTKLLITTLYTF